MLLRKFIDPCRCWGADGRAAFVGMVALVLLAPAALSMAVTPFVVATVDLPTREPEGARLLLIGNSMVDTRINPDLLEDLLGAPVAYRTAPGSRSAAWYLMLRLHIENASEPAPVAAIFFREDELTRPLSRTEGQYQRQLLALAGDDTEVLDEILMRNRSPVEAMQERLDTTYGLAGLRDHARSAIAWIAGAIVVADKLAVPESQAVGQSDDGNRLEVLDDEIDDLHEALNSRFAYGNWRTDALMQAEIGGASGTTAFPERPADTFLEPIINLADAHGIHLVFVRVNRKDEVLAGADRFAAYTMALERYVTGRGHSLISMIGDPELTADKFLDAAGHLDPRYLDWYTNLFARRLHKVLPIRGAIAWHKHGIQ